MRKLIPVLTFILFSIPLAETFSQNAISGKITSKHEQQGVAFVQVQVVGNNGDKQATTADSLGNFQFTDLKDSLYTLQIQTIGFNPLSQKVKAGEIISIVMTEDAHYAETVEIYGNRFGKREEEVISITIIDQKELLNQTSINSNINEVLGKKVPGMAVSTESASSYGQGIRGRDILVLVDGIPQTSPIRSSSRGLRSVDVAAVEQVEVVRGATAIYGYGATGGIVNMTTKQPDFNKDTIGFTASVSGNTSMVTEKSAYQNVDPLGGRAFLQTMGQKGKFYFLLNGAAEHIGKYYDAQGDIIPLDPLGQGGLANTNNYNGLAKAGYHINSQSKVEIRGNYYDSQQKPGFISTGGVYGKEKAKAREMSQNYSDMKGTATKTLNVSALYHHKQIFKNTAFNTVVFYQNMYVRFPYDPNSGYFPNYNGKTSAQTYIGSEKLGSRIDFVTEPKSVKNLHVNYGIDFLYDVTDQNLTDGRVWVPKINQINLAPFLQVTKTLFSKLILRGGARYETVSLAVNDFTVLTDGHQVKGGTLFYDQMLFNAGARLELHQLFSPYVAFGQGFATTEVGRELRATAVDNVTDIHPKAQVVDNYELGWDTKIGRDFKFSTVGFYNTSQYGVTLMGTSLDVERAPERIYGYEIEASYKWRRFRLAGSYSYVEGKRDSDGNGSYDEYLSGVRIAAPKATAELTYRVTDKGSVTFQGLYSGNRNRFNADSPTKGFGTGAVKEYMLFDLMGNYRIGKGTFSIGVYNLFNTFYFPPVSRFAASNVNYVAGRGRTIALTYTINFGL